MGSIRIFILWAQWIVFRRPSVILYDHNGEFNARLAHGFGNNRYAKRYGFGIRNCVLAPNGGFVNDTSYVIRWEPLFPANFSI